MPLGGTVSYYNGTSYGPYTGHCNASVTFLYTRLIYLRFKACGIEAVTMAAGTPDCWKITVPNSSDPNGVDGCVHPPSAKNYVKADMTTSNRANEYRTVIGAGE